MNNIKRAVVSGVATVGLLLGMAGAAQAATYRTYTVNHQNGWCTSYTVVNYDWWEETFQGKRDYTYANYTYRCAPWSFSSVG